jgi:hypothetical protein
VQTGQEASKPFPYLVFQRHRPLSIPREGIHHLYELLSLLLRWEATHHPIVLSLLQAVSLT